MIKGRSRWQFSSFMALRRCNGPRHTGQFAEKRGQLRHTVNPVLKGQSVLLRLLICIGA
jgi:hypothetical protein